MSAGHVALVLAAGGSRRLGRPKQLLTRDGEPLVHRTVRLALESGASRVLLVVGAEHERVQATVADLDCDLVANPDWTRGLGSSLQAAAPRVRASGGRPVLVLPCDLPGLEASHLRALVQGAATAASGCAATQVGGTVGVPALVPSSWFDAFADADADAGADRGFGPRLRALAPGTLWVLDAADAAQDIDSPADVEAAVARGWLDPVAPADGAMAPAPDRPPQRP
ncbi:nucleotidyltransferase family protein [Luteimonas sp. M1R5S18]|uniref:Nucleotidyltransferase family protein n=1 Tax=Luteimonas rhizosphaericola TaxID=3042024 RepID=A0ABT6JHM0_9GAMM|nr:nucleotidyltransferase family protein [Luteimonas rhizosphaericola]MDH5830162.1 nucleotidyltransferase family protein [Luteimonas rhizosphaericola]